MSPLLGRKCTRQWMPNCTGVVVAVEYLSHLGTDSGWYVLVLHEDGTLSEWGAQELQVLP